MVFRALVLESKSGPPEVVEVAESSLPEDELAIAVEYSSLNYKDAMVLAGIGGLARSFPHIPGIDLAGTVERSASSDFASGDRVVVTGWRVGETRWGGFATRANVPAQFAVRVPDGIELFEAMAIGTAGFTAMMAVDTLRRFGTAFDRRPDGPLLVTGAAGGVGSIAVRLASLSGYRVVASTGRDEHRRYLEDLGAAEVVDRRELSEPPAKPMLSERWGAAIDPVGGDTLGHLVSELEYGAAVASCGLAQSPDLATSVVPFLLRGVSILGVDSVFCPIERRRSLWTDLESHLGEWDVREVATTIGLADLVEAGQEILAGRVRGRIVVDVTR